MASSRARVFLTRIAWQVGQRRRQRRQGKIVSDSANRDREREAVAKPEVRSSTGSSQWKGLGGLSGWGWPTTLIPGPRRALQLRLGRCQGDQRLDQPLAARHQQAEMLQLMQERRFGPRHRHQPMDLDQPMAARHQQAEMLQLMQERLRPPPLTVGRFRRFRFRPRQRLDQRPLDLDQPFAARHQQAEMLQLMQERRVRPRHRHQPMELDQPLATSHQQPEFCSLKKQVRSLRLCRRHSHQSLDQPLAARHQQAEMQMLQLMQEEQPVRRHHHRRHHHRQDQPLAVRQRPGAAAGAGAAT